MMELKAVIVEDEAKNLLLIQEPNIEEIYNDVIIEFIDL